MSIISNTLQIAEISFFVGTQGLGEVFRVCPKWHAFLLQIFDFDANVEICDGRERCEWKQWRQCRSRRSSRLSRLSSRTWILLLIVLKFQVTHWCFRIGVSCVFSVFLVSEKGICGMDTLVVFVTWGSWSLNCNSLHLAPLHEDSSVGFSWAYCIPSNSKDL